MKRKKILIAVSSLGGGGAERVATVWASQLAECGYDVSIFAVSRSADEYPLSDKVRVYVGGQTREDYLSKSYFQRFRNIRSILKTVDPDYILPFLFTIRIYMMFASIGLRAKRIDTLRISPWVYDSFKLPARILSHICYDVSHKIILQANDQKDWFSKRNQKKCILVPNPISPLYKTNYKEYISQDVLNFIAAGRIDPQKNYPMMIDAFASVVKQYPNIKLRIFGKGSEDYTQKLQDQINSLGMQESIFLMGRSSEIHIEYKKSDVFLMTSDCEGLPNALIEAMASRLICISTDCKTGPRDLIDHNENGYMIPVGDSKALAQSIVNVMNMTYEERVAMADKARTKIMSYCSEENSLKRLCSVFK